MEDNTAARTIDAGRRAASYWFEDGLPELLFGFALALLGITTLLAGRYLSLNWTRGLTAGAVLTLLAVWFFHRQVLDVLKARITYPRTGYAQPPASQPGDRASVPQADPEGRDHFDG